jgi:hypothetical protein
VRKLRWGYPHGWQVLWGHLVRLEFGEEVRRFGAIVDKSGQITYCVLRNKAEGEGRGAGAKGASDPHIRDSGFGIQD